MRNQLPRFSKSWVHIIGRALQSFLFAIFFFFLFNEKFFLEEMMPDHAKATCEQKEKFVASSY
jgi:ABC-type microcin C transport system permease subunit YejB